MLKPYTGSGNDPCKQIIVSSRKSDKLVTDSHNKGEGDQTDARSCQYVEYLMVNETGGNKQADEYRYEKHQNKE